MLTVAVTGGIGAGKSTVARILGELGAIVIDSDRLAREVVAPGTPGLADVAGEFGDAVLTADGALDRAALAKVVFADAGARARLEAIVHPRVRAAFRRQRDAAGPDAVVVNDIPLVRNAAEAAEFDLVVVVVADEDVRLARLVRRGLDEPDARARMAAQISDAERMALADVTVTNNGDQDALREQIRRLWESVLLPALAENPPDGAPGVRDHG